MSALVLILVAAAPVASGYDAPLPELKFPAQFTLAEGIPIGARSVDAETADARFFSQLRAPEFAALKLAYERSRQLHSGETRFFWGGAVKINGAPFALAHVQTGPAVDEPAPETWLIALGPNREPLAGVLLATSSLQTVTETECDATAKCTRTTSSFDSHDHHRRRWDREVFTVTGFRNGALQRRDAARTVRDYFDTASQEIFTVLINDALIDCYWRKGNGGPVVLGRVTGGLPDFTVELEDHRRFSLKLSANRGTLEVTADIKTTRFVAVGVDTPPKLTLPLVFSPGKPVGPPLRDREVNARLRAFVKDDDLGFANVWLDGEFEFRGTRYWLLERYSELAYGGWDASLAALDAKGTPTTFVAAGELSVPLHIESKTTITADGGVTVTTETELRDQDVGELRGLLRSVHTTSLIPGGFAKVAKQDRHRTTSSTRRAERR